jgi:hypothetical protein
LTRERTGKVGAESSLGRLIVNASLLTVWLVPCPPYTFIAWLLGLGVYEGSGTLDLAKATRGKEKDFPATTAYLIDETISKSVLCAKGRTPTLSGS